MRKLSTLAIVPAVAGLLTFPIGAGAQEDAGRARKLAPIDGAQQVATDTHPDTGRWMRALASDQLAARESAWRELLDAARREPSALRDLKRWAGDETDVDRAWNARLALRELQLSRDPLGGLLDPFGSGRRDDALADPFGQRMTPRQHMPPPQHMFDASRMFEDMQRQLDQMLQGPGWMQPFGQPPATPPPGSSMKSDSFSFQAGPGGVKVELRELVDGKEELKTYEADSLAELLETYPELRGRIQGNPGLPGDARGQLEDLRGRLQDSPFGRWSDPFGAPSAGAVPTDRLGILMREPGSYSASMEGLEPGVGLLVERVFPDTIAGELGLQPGDVVTELNGRKLTSGEDVRAALAQRESDEPVVLKLVDSLGQQRVLIWKPSDEKRDAGQPLKLRPL